MLAFGLDKPQKNKEGGSGHYVRGRIYFDGQIVRKFKKKIDECRG